MVSHKTPRLPMDTVTKVTVTNVTVTKVTRTFVSFNWYGTAAVTTEGGVFGILRRDRFTPRPPPGALPFGVLWR